MECKQTREICAKLKAAPIRALVYPLIGGAKAPGGAMTPKGWPDRFITFNFVHPLTEQRRIFSGFVEFKLGDAPLRPDQEQIIRSLNKAGTLACVVRIGDQTGTTYYSANVPGEGLSYSAVSSSDLAEILAMLYFNYSNQRPYQGEST